jgi:hypothetical protein
MKNVECRMKKDKIWTNTFWKEMENHQVKDYTLDEMIRYARKKFTNKNLDK